MDVHELGQLFDSSFRIVQALDENNILETNSTEFQDLVKRGVEQLEKTTQMINTLQLFSTNESLDEVTSTNIKYLLTPALLAFLSEKCTRQDRIRCIESAEVYYTDFLRRLNDYGVTSYQSDGGEVEVVQRESDLRDVARDRQSKIERYKRMKEMSAQLKLLSNYGDDEELMRRYHVLLLKKWAEVAKEELDSLKMEVQLLKRREKSVSTELPNRKPREPFKPFIITRNEIEKKVFGLGYPSVPTMTVNEFVDQKERDGTWAFSNKNIYSNSLQQWAEDPDRKHREDDEIESKKESLAEKEDEESEAAVQKARNWDEFKDDVKRGSGNRRNMS